MSSQANTRNSFRSKRSASDLVRLKSAFASATIPREYFSIAKSSGILGLRQNDFTIPGGAGLHHSIQQKQPPFSSRFLFHSWLSHLPGPEPARGQTPL